MPNGNLLKQNRPKGVINVVNLQEAEKPDIASSLLNTLASLNWARISYILGRGYFSLWTLIQMCEIHTNPDLTIGFLYDNYT